MAPTYDFPELLVLQGAVLVQLTDEEFFDLCQANPTLDFERRADRAIIIRPLAGAEASEASGEVCYQLGRWNRPTRPGHVYESSAGFMLPDTSVRSPDAAWLSQAQWQALTPAQRRGFPPVCPEFIVEIRPYFGDIAVLETKMKDYLANGMKLGFLLDVGAETAYVYRPGQPTETMQGYARHLSGELVLPGFRLDLHPLRRRG